VNNYTTGTIFEATLGAVQTEGANPFFNSWFVAPFAFNATIDPTTGLLLVSAAINTNSTNVESYLLDFNSTNSYFYTTMCKQLNGDDCSAEPVLATESISTDGKLWTLSGDSNTTNTLFTSGYKFSGTYYSVYSYLTANDSSVHYDLPVKSEYLAVDEVHSTTYSAGVAAESGALGFGKASNLVWGVTNYTMKFNGQNFTAD